MRIGGIMNLTPNSYLFEESKFLKQILEILNKYNMRHYMYKFKVNTSKSLINDSYNIHIFFIEIEIDYIYGTTVMSIQTSFHHTAMKFEDYIKENWWTLL